MPQFRQYNTGGQKTKEEALLEPISQTLQTLPALWMEYKKNRLKSDLEIQALQKQLGTGKPAPMTSEQVIPGSITPGVGGPEEQMLGAEARPLQVIPPQPIPETKEETLKRMGSLDYKALNEKQYATPIQDSNGNIIGWNKLEEGLTPIGVSSRGGGALDQKRTFQYVGTTDDGKPVHFDTRTGKFAVGTVEGVTDGNVNPKLQNPSPGEVDTMTLVADVSKVLQQVDENYDDKYVGPVMGNIIGKGKQYIESLSDEKAGRFYGSIMNLRSILVYLRSGKQINQEEYNRLLAALPNEAKSPTDFKAKMKNFVEEYKTLVKGREDIMKKSGRALRGTLNLYELKNPSLVQENISWTADDEKRLQELERKAKGGE